jgi:hypothetical protein
MRDAPLFSLIFHASLTQNAKSLVIIQRFQFDRHINLCIAAVSVADALQYRGARQRLSHILFKEDG